MKKVLALVLALVMVLALVPVAFAATTTISNSDYKVVADVALKADADLTQIKDPGFNTTPDASGKAPALEIKLPYKQIDTVAATGIWASASDLDITLSVQNFGGKDEIFSDTSTLDATKIKNIKINGKEYTAFGGTEAITLGANNALSFKMGDVSSLDKTYEYVVEITGKDGSTAADYYEKMTFTVKFTNIDKPVYDLKVAAIEGATLKDGVWFIDSETDDVTTTAAQDITLRKNDGSKFTEVAYATAAKDDYEALDVTDLDALVSSVLENVDLTTLFTTVTADTKYTLALRVETEFAVYEGKVNLKYRTNVKAVDPKGVSFDKDEYTIGVNQVFYPGYTFIVNPLKDVAGDITLEQTSYGEKNIIDIDSDRDGGKDAIIGLKEGTAYVKLAYTVTNDADGVNATVTYTDTAKIIVSGTYSVQPDENFVVTVASGSCLYKRAAASTSAANLGKLQNGTVIKVAEIKDGWAKVIASDFTNYYVSAAYITRQGTKAFNGTGVVIARCLNVRAGAGTTYAVVGHLYRNAKIDIAELSADGAWGKITYQGNTAYVAMKYIQ